MPLVGVGSVYLLTGVDTGAGFQPAYILLALAFGVQVLGGGSRWIVSAGRQHRWWVNICLAVLIVLGLSALGLFWHRTEAGWQMSAARQAPEP